MSPIRFVDGLRNTSSNTCCVRGPADIVVNVVNPDWGLIGITLIFCLIGRACNIFPLCALYNLCVKEQSRVSLKDQVVMLHAGLRGAIAFALALTFPSHNIHIVLNTTMWVILFTIFVLGGSCTSVLTVLRVDMGVKSNDVGDTKKSRHSKELTNVFQKFDRLVILPLVSTLNSITTIPKMSHALQGALEHLGIASRLTFCTTGNLAFYIRRRRHVH